MRQLGSRHGTLIRPASERSGARRLICLVVESDDFTGGRDVSEEWPGFQELFRVMEKELGISPGWYMEIMTPVFEPTPRLLFDRAAHSQHPVEGSDG
jgi:hypothetical protein